MPLKVQSIPRGLRAQLGAVGGGANPDELLDQIRGTVELEHFYLQDQLEVAFSVDTLVSTVAQFGQIDVPAGEVWRVVAVGTSYSAFSAATNIRAAVVVSPPGGFGVPVVQDTAAIAAAGDNFTLGIFNPSPLILPSGSFIATLNGEAGVPTYTITTTALFHRLRA